MNETIALPRLAQLLASKCNISLSDAEKFIRQFFSQIESSLTVSDEVSIKGLGKFHVDIASGVDFTPDKEFSDFLNLPFEMFSPVEIGDPDALDYSDEDIASSENSPADIINVEVSADAVAATDLSAGNETDEHLSETVSATRTTDMNECEETPVSELQTEEIAAEKPQAEEEITCVETEAAAETKVADEPEYMEPAAIDEKSRYRTPVFGYLFTAVVCLALGYLVRDFIGMGKTASETSADIPEVIAIPADSVLTPAETPAYGPDSLSVSENRITEEETAEINTPDQDNGTKESKEPITDTVTPERFLTTMARKYYGRMEYWVFIYLANEESLGNPNRIRPGTRVIIPDKADFSDGETPEQTLARAKRLGQEIYARFE